jgi:L-ascorbate metabolism protein UlaG (beta-lactamase superfamily)
VVSAAGGQTHPDRPGLGNYAAPFSFLNKAFAGEYPWRAESMPEIDLLIISHDHYDHLDYATIRALLPKVKRVVTPLGVGSHLRYWGMKPRLLTSATGTSRCASAMN